MQVNNNSMHDLKNDFPILRTISEIRSKLNELEKFILGRAEQDYLESIEKGNSDET